jgi:porin
MLTSPRQAAAVLVTMCAVPGSIPAVHAAAADTASPPPARETAGGNWAGVRDSLGANGVRVDFWTTGFVQSMVQGTGDDGWDSTLRADLMVDADTGRLNLWSGGGLHAHLEYYTGGVPGQRDGTVLPQNSATNFPVDSRDDVVATSLYVSQRFGDSTRLMVGKINTLDLLARNPFFGGWGTDRFQLVSFAAPPNGITPPVIKGAVLTHSARPYSYTLMVFDPADRTTGSSLSDLFSGGVVTSLGASWAGEWAGRASHAGFTATYSTGEDVDFREIGFPPGTENGSPRKNRGSYNVTLDGSHLLVESAVAPGRGLGLYARIGVADGNPNLIEAQYTAGIAGHALIPSRPADYFGVGYFYFDLSSALRNSLRPIRRFDDEQGAEAFYAYVPVPWLRLSAHVQWVNPSQRDNETIWIGGLRARVAF